MSGILKNIQASLFILLLLPACVATKNTSQKLSSKLSLEIDTSQGVFRQNRWMVLYVKFTNNSEEAITILKPSVKYGAQLDFFKTSIKCQQPSVVEWSEPPLIMRQASELITIKAKSSVTLKVRGNLYDLICGSKKVSVKIRYNSQTIREWVMKKFNVAQKQSQENIYKKLTKVIVESPETEISLH
mgnify:CR=1 FL=1